MSRLSSKQTALLCALTCDHRPADGTTLANRLGSPVSGVHRTAASLARRGLIYTLRYSGLGVQYELAPAGRAALEDTGPAT